MAIHSDLMRPPVFVAQSLAEHKETRRVRETRPGEIDSEASRSLSEEPSIINCCKYGIGLPITSPSDFVQLVILSEAKTLGSLLFTSSLSQ
jgi:hypothetical protein